MPRYVKLESPGEEIRILATDVRFDKTGKWADWKVRGTTPDGEDVVVSIPVKAAQRQLDQMGEADVESEGDTDRVKALLVDRGLLFARSLKVGDNGKPYWNLSFDGTIAQGGNNQPKPKRVQSSESGGTGLPAPEAVARPSKAHLSFFVEQERKRLWLLDVYAGLFAGMATALPKVEAAVVQNATATIWIQCGKDGLLDVPPAAFAVEPEHKAKADKAPTPKAPARSNAPVGDWNEAPPGEPDDELPF